jgi:hypothetical protein
MANSENLKPIKKGELSKDEAKRRGSKGGKAKAESMKQKKTMREMLDYLLEKEITNNKGEKATTLEAMMTAVCKKAISGDVKANEFVRDTTGQRPVETHVITTPEQIEEAQSELDKALQDAKKRRNRAN